MKFPTKQEMLDELKCARYIRVRGAGVGSITQEGLQRKWKRFVDKRKKEEE